MNFSDPKRLSVFVAFVITMFAFLIYLLSQLFPLPTASWLKILLFMALLFGFTFIVFRYSIEKFIYEKIRLIYKTIHNLKRPKEGEKSKMNMAGDALDKVQRQVLEWGEDRANEIEELKALAAYRREFIGNVSHELKTPIFNIQGYVLTLLDGGLDDPAINRDYLLRTEKSINRMIAIVNDLESIAQLESGELKLNFSRFDIVGLTREAIDLLEVKVKKKDAVIYFAEAYDKPVMVLADKERIREALINLIDNSVKYGAKPGGKTKISFFDMDKHILVEITDDGMGISRQDIPRVFERFYRTDKGRSREQGGTGLGLAIVKHIIEAHQQTISVRSTIGIGSTFGFTLKKGS
ncbi:MAG: ATP-binding protein [Bacteroidales bacterium]|nr:ATP-binding protein [Bacteroidales bacterium]MDZ4205121.1 ATP-binding protein [Bacteroidales bacterium]